MKDAASLFEKQLTASDLKDSQSRLKISKSDAGNYLHPLLNEGENLAHGIEVNTYGPDGKQLGMMYKICAGKTHVLFGKWKAFYNEYDLESHQDFVTIWTFRRRDTRTLCFVIKWRRLPCLNQPTRKDRGIIDQMLIVLVNTLQDFIHDNVQLAALFFNHR